MHLFNSAEHKALEWIIAGHADGVLIEAQLLTARLISRRVVGDDFLTAFDFIRDPRYRLDRGPFVGDAWAHVRGRE